MTVTDPKEALDPQAPVDTPTSVPDAWKRPGHVIASYMQKGGTGKSEMTKGTAKEYAKYGVPTVAVDLDPHGVLTAGLNHPLVEDQANLANLLTGRWQGSILDLVVERQGIPLVPSNVDMALVEQDLASVRFREERLRTALGPLLERYNVLLDCPNNPGLLNDNALIAAANESGESRRGGLVIVMQLDGPSMHSLELLLDQVDSLNGATRYRVDLLGWVGNQVDNRTNLVGKIRNDLAELPLEPLGEVPIRTVIKNAWAAGKLVDQYDPRSPVHHFFRRVAHNVLRRIHE